MDHEIEVGMEVEIEDSDLERKFLIYLFQNRAKNFYFQLSNFRRKFVGRFHRIYGRER